MLIIDGEEQGKDMRKRRSASRLREGRKVQKNYDARVGFLLSGDHGKRGDIRR